MLFIGDDWAQDHRDIEIEDDTGRRLARARLPEGMEGIAKLHALIAEHAPTEWVDLPADQVVVGIETDRGPWVVALQAAGYLVFAINPLSAARYRQRHSTSGAKSDAGDAHVLAEIVRLDRAHHRQIAGDSDLADAVKLLTRAHQNAIWERTRHVLRLRSALNEFFPAAVHAFEGPGRPGCIDPARQGSRPGSGRPPHPQPGNVRTARRRPAPRTGQSRIAT